MTPHEREEHDMLMEYSGFTDLFVGGEILHDHTTDYVIVPDWMGKIYLNVLAQGPITQTDAEKFGYDVLVMDQGGQFWAEHLPDLSYAPTCACGNPYYPGGRACHPYA